MKFHSIEELSRDIADVITDAQYIKTAKNVTASIHYLVGRGILDEGLFKKCVISGEALQEQFIVSSHMLRRKLTMDAYLLVDVNAVLQKNGFSAEETPVSAEETGVIAEETPQKKGKEIKEKEIKVYTHHQSSPPQLPDNVVLTPQQYRDLCERIPDADAFIRRFAWRIAERGYTYSDHHAAILSWWEKDQSKLSQQGVSTPPRDSSFEADTFAQIAMKQSLELAKRKESENNGKI